MKLILENTESHNNTDALMNACDLMAQTHRAQILSYNEQEEGENLMRLIEY